MTTPRRWACGRYVVLAATVLAVFVTAPPARADFVSWDYTLDTPVFADVPFAPLNVLLAGAGPTITGTISFDTADVTLPDPGNIGTDTYLAPAFTHVGELDSIGFDFNADTLRTVTSSPDLALIFFWGISGDPLLYWAMSFQFPGVAAFCASPEGRCDGQGFLTQVLTLPSRSYPRPRCPR